MKPGTMALVLVAVLPLFVPASLLPQDTSRGKQLYDRWCAGCHGETGKGDGPAAAYMLPRPRDFTTALYQVRTTASGQIPTDADIMRVIDEGMPGTAMPGWSSRLSGGDRRELVSYLKSLSPFFAGPAPELVEAAGAPRVSAAGLEEGGELYQRLECWKCHGNAGRADGPSAPTLRDRADFPVPPANLTENWRFNGGGEVEDIYMRLLTGLDGTPMPASKDLLEAKVITPEQLWRVAQYVRSLSPDAPPPVRDVLRARLAEGALPAHPDDSAWADVEEFYVPLVGQIIEAPRWFAPRVEGVYVRALYDGDRVALRLRWSDPSRSPDPAWAEWRGAMARTMTPADGPLDSLPRPDGVMVQFPPAIPDDGTRPYFLMGEPKNPIYAWRWQSAPPLAEAGRATGLGTFAALTDAAESPAAEAVFDNGEWRLVFTRARATPDSASALQFASGRAIPVAFFAWDGDHGEGETRIAISSWYFLVLEEPTPASAYTTPIVAAMLTLMLGWMVIWRAQARERGRRTT